MIDSQASKSQHYPPPPYRYPIGLHGASGIPGLAKRLRERGFNKEALKGVLGGNFMRVLSRRGPRGTKEVQTDA